jgi:hypothetical protein
LNKRFLLVGAIVAVVALAGTTAVLAATGDRARQARTLAPTAAVGTASGGGCKAGYDTQTSVLTPPDDSTTDNPPAGSVTFTKSCTGAVVGQFTSETSIPSGGFIHLDMIATCIGTGGFSTHCTVGQTVFAQPGHTFFSQNASGIETHAMDMVWPGLTKGQWTFTVRPGGNGTAFVDFRTFFVEAFNGG